MGSLGRKKEHALENKGNLISGYSQCSRSDINTPELIGTFSLPGMPTLGSKHSI